MKIWLGALALLAHFFESGLAAQIIGLSHTSATADTGLQDRNCAYQCDTDVATFLTRRGLSSGISPGSDHRKGFRHQESQALVLRSSSQNITGCGGYRLYGLPIFSNDLSGLLTDTRADLDSRNLNTSTKFYQYNTTRWTFFVVAPKATIPYALIRAIAIRFQILASSKTSMDLTMTRVGVLLNGSEAIADVGINALPHPATAKSLHSPGATVPAYDIATDNTTTDPIEIVRFTLYDSSCAYESINDRTALSIFSDAPSSISDTSPRSRRSVESQILARVAQTAYAISMRISRGAYDGHPVQIEMWMVEAVLAIAMIQLIFGMLVWSLAHDAIGDPELEAALGDFLGMNLDTGFYLLGKMAMRLVITITKRDSSGRIILLKGSTWQKLVQRLLEPLTGISIGSQDKGWAMEGEVFGPEDGDMSGSTRLDEAGAAWRNATQVEIGRWQLMVGDVDEFF